LRPRWKTLRKLVRLRPVSRHPFTCCDGTRRRPRWWVSASRYPAAPDRLSAPALGRGRCSSPTSATDPRHVYLFGSLDSRGGAHAFARFATSDGGEPQRTTRVTTCLTARHELPPRRLTSPPIRRGRIPPDPAGLPIVIEPAVWHPPSAALSSVDGPNVLAFDALVATRVRRSAARAARTAFPTPSSKGMARATRDAFHRRVPRSTAPACARPASNARPATDPGTLPPRSGFRRSFAPRSRRRRS
jgi:hypothetical protein